MPTRIDLINFLRNQVIDVMGYSINTQIQGALLCELMELEHAITWIEVVRALQERHVPPAIYIFLGVTLAEMRQAETR